MKQSEVVKINRLYAEALSSPEFVADRPGTGDPAYCPDWGKINEQALIKRVRSVSTSCRTWSVESYPEEFISSVVCGDHGYHIKWEKGDVHDAVLVHMPSMKMSVGDDMRSTPCSLDPRGIGRIVFDMLTDYQEAVTDLTFGLTDETNGRTYSGMSIPVVAHTDDNGLKEYATMIHFKACRDDSSHYEGVACGDVGVWVSLGQYPAGEWVPDFPEIRDSYISALDAVLDVQVSEYHTTMECEGCPVDAEFLDLGSLDRVLIATSGYCRNCMAKLHRTGNDLVDSKAIWLDKARSEGVQVNIVSPPPRGFNW